MKVFIFKIRRRDNPEADAFWETFRFTFPPRVTVISALREIQMNPVNAQGEGVCPVAWEANCLEGACGSCVMIINGKPLLACQTYLEGLKSPVVLEPLTQFPVVRDLVVDRSRYFADLKRVHDWIPFNQREMAEGMDEANPLAACIDCGLCLEVCPQYSQDSPYVGAAVIARSDLRSRFLKEGIKKSESLSVLMGKGGVNDCGNAQNCQNACPKGLPLLESIARMKRKVTVEFFGRLLGR